MDEALQGGRSMIALGKELIDSGDYDGALNIISEVRRQFPNTDLSDEAQAIQEALIDRKIGR